MNVIKGRDFASSIGESAGRGLSGALAKLAESKYKQLEERSAIKKLTDTGAFDEQTAAIINSLPEKDKWSAIQALAYDQQQENQLVPQQYDQSGMPSQMQQPQQQLIQENPAYRPQMQQQIQQQQRQPSFAERLRGAQNPAQKKLIHAEQKAADAETKEYYDNILGLQDAAKFSEMRLGKMEQLLNKGGLSTAAAYKFLKGVEEHAAPATTAVSGGLVGARLGGPIGALAGTVIGGLIGPVASVFRAGQNIINPNNEQFEKLSNDFVREAKSIFGSRITDTDLKVFLSLVPTLSQTDNGKRQIIENLRSFNRAARVKYDAMKMIIRANGGHRPFNLAEQVEAVAGPELERLSQEFAVS